MSGPQKLVRTAKLTYLWATRVLLSDCQEKLPLTKRIHRNVQGFTAGQHVLYELDSNPAADYLTEMDWYRSRYLNHPFESMLNNKVVCAQILSPYVRVPQTFAVKSGGDLTLIPNLKSITTMRAILEVIQRRQYVFWKPISAGKGVGVRKIGWSDGQYQLDGNEISENALAKVLDDDNNWFLCESMQQHRSLARLHPETTNTVRLITVRDQRTGCAQVLFAVLRIGTKSTVPVDNGSRGGLISLVDIQRGTLSEARALWEAGEHTHHPDTGAPIRGVAVPAWNEAKEVATHLADLFPYLKLVAWDLLITDREVVVIEANASTGVNIIQMWGPQRNGPLGEFYKHHGVIK